jgi:hypothetical protein
MAETWNDSRITAICGLSGIIWAYAVTWTGRNKAWRQRGTDLNERQTWTVLDDYKICHVQVTTDFVVFLDSATSSRGNFVSISPLKFYLRCSFTSSSSSNLSSQSYLVSSRLLIVKAIVITVFYCSFLHRMFKHSRHYRISWISLTCLFSTGIEANFYTSTQNSYWFHILWLYF